MGIDWITFAAQLINLAILAALLYRFLFKPLLAAIDAREAHIATEIGNAEKMAAEAEKRLEELDGKHRELDASRRDILDQARLVADNLRLRLEREIQDDVLEKRTRLAEELEQERRSMESELRDAVVSNFTRLAQKAFRELADSTFEARIVEVLIRRFSELPDSEKCRLEPKSEEETPVVVRSAFDLDSETQEKIGALLSGALDLSNAAVLFEVDPKLSCGVEISVNGNVLSWNLEDYLRDFTDNMNKTLQEMSLRLNRREN